MSLRTPRDLCSLFCHVKRSLYIDTSPNQSSWLTDNVTRVHFVVTSTVLCTLTPRLTEEQMHDHHSYVQVHYVHNCTAVLYTDNAQSSFIHTSKLRTWSKENTSRQIRLLYYVSYINLVLRQLVHTSKLHTWSNNNSSRHIWLSYYVSCINLILEQISSFYAISHNFQNRQNYTPPIFCNIFIKTFQQCCLILEKIITMIIYQSTVW
jgi:hypothetical protein